MNSFFSVTGLDTLGKFLSRKRAEDRAEDLSSLRVLDHMFSGLLENIIFLLFFTIFYKKQILAENMFESEIYMIDF